MFVASLSSPPQMEELPVTAGEHMYGHAAAHESGGSQIARVDGDARVPSPHVDGGGRALQPVRNSIRKAAGRRFRCSLRAKWRITDVRDLARPTSVRPRAETLAAESRTRLTST